jgi:hypothetical protein
MKRIISFSLWGQKPLYCDGAVANAELMPKFYKDSWKCLFYIDETTVSQDTIAAIIKNGGEVRTMGHAEDVLGMYWRFHPMFDDPEVERFIVRDTDSKPTQREVDCVNEWIESEKDFHIVRDCESHNVQILGGTWGAKANCIPYFETKMKVWFSQLQPNYGNPRGLFHGTDQLFLAKEIWPIIKNNHIAHVRAGMPHLKFTSEDRELPVLEEGGHYVGMVA